MDSGRRYFRQLLSGRDFAPGDPLALAMVNYAYAIGDRETGEAILVDPAYDPAGLVELVRADGLEVTGAVVTHYHGDHAGGPIGSMTIPGVAELLAVAPVPVHAQASELPWLERSTGVDRSAFVGHDPGDVLAIGATSVTLIHTPGHTPGSQCLLVDGALLSGDTLFLTGCGRTDLPGGDPEALADSLRRVLAPLDPSVMVFPGHAYDPAPSATIGNLVRTNPVFGQLGVRVDPLDEGE